MASRILSESSGDLIASIRERPEMASRASQRGKSPVGENPLATAIALRSFASKAIFCASMTSPQGASWEETDAHLEAPHTVDFIDVRGEFHMVDPVSFSAGATADLEIARVVELFSLVRREPVSQKPQAASSPSYFRWQISDTTRVQR